MENLKRKIAMAFFKFKNHIQELKKYNTCNTQLFILKKYVYGKDVFFKISGIGDAFDIKLKASDLAKNASLLRQFSVDDRNEIVLESGLCTYSLIEVGFMESKTLITIKAKFKKLDFVKKYTPDEIISNKKLYSILDKSSKDYIKQFSNQKIIHVDFKKELATYKKEIVPKLMQSS